MEPLKNRIQGTHGTPLSMGKASGRMHHHDKHAATKDGHRADDPHAVTGNTFPPSGWKQDEINAQAAGARRAIRTTERANAADMDALTQRHSEIQAVLDEPNIQREGHEVFDEGTDYGQRVSAFGNVERDVSDEQGGGYDVQGDEMVDLVEGEEDQAYAKVGTYGQDMPPRQPPTPPPPTSKPSEPPDDPFGTKTKHQKDYEKVRDKDDSAKYRQWHSMQSGANKVSERLGIKAPNIPAPRQAGWKSGPPAPHMLMPRSAPPEPPR